MADVLARLGDSGLGEDAIAHFLERVVRLDSEDARMYAADIAASRGSPPSDEDPQDGGQTVNKPRSRLGISLTPKSKEFAEVDTGEAE